MNHIAILASGVFYADHNFVIASRCEEVVLSEINDARNVIVDDSYCTRLDITWEGC